MVDGRDGLELARLIHGKEIGLQGHITAIECVQGFVGTQLDNPIARRLQSEHVQVASCLLVQGLKPGLYGSVHSFDQPVDPTLV